MVVPPKSYATYWKDLTDDQRFAATQICYTSQDWDHIVSESESKNVVGMFVGIAITLVLIGLAGYVGWKLYLIRKSDNMNNKSLSSNNDEITFSNTNITEDDVDSTSIICETETNNTPPIEKAVPA